MIATKTDDRRREARCYNWLGNLVRHLGDDVKTKMYYEKAPAISMAISNRAEEAAIYVDLGSLYMLLDKYVKAEEYLSREGSYYG